MKDLKFSDLIKLSILSGIILSVTVKVLDLIDSRKPTSKKVTKKSETKK